MIPYPDGPGGAPVFPYNPVIDGDFLVNAPIAAFQEGSFARVPTIWGDVTDEGTIFTPRDISNEIETTTFLEDNWPTMNASSFDEYATLYNLSSSSTPPNPFWYKASEAYGETRYICPGMQLPNLMRQNGFDQVWNYRFNVLDPQGVANGNYVSHGADVPALFGAVAGGPPSYSTTNKNIIPVMQGYWTSFIQTQDPNQLRASGTPEWQLWDGKSRLLLETNTTTMETVPSAQLQRCDFLAEISVGLDQ
jgi:carboxylesterase type B